MIGKQRISATVDADLLAIAERAAAEGRAKNVSAWINDAMRQKAEDDLRREAARKLIEDYEAEHGVITAAEMARAARDMKARAIVVRGRKRTKRAPSRRKRR